MKNIKNHRTAFERIEENDISDMLSSRHQYKAPPYGELSVDEYLLMFNETKKAIKKLSSEFSTPAYVISKDGSQQFPIDLVTNSQVVKSYGIDKVTHIPTWIDDDEERGLDILAHDISRHAQDAVILLDEFVMEVSNYNLSIKIDVRNTGQVGRKINQVIQIHFYDRSKYVELSEIYDVSKALIQEVEDSLKEQQGKETQKANLRLEKQRLFPGFSESAQDFLYKYPDYTQLVSDIEKHFAQTDLAEQLKEQYELEFSKEFSYDGRYYGDISDKDVTKSNIYSNDYHLASDGSINLDVIMDVEGTAELLSVDDSTDYTEVEFTGRIHGYLNFPKGTQDFEELDFIMNEDSLDLDLT